MFLQFSIQQLPTASRKRSLFNKFDLYNIIYCISPNPLSASEGKYENPTRNALLGVRTADLMNAQHHKIRTRGLLGIFTKHLYWSTHYSFILFYFTCRLTYGSLKNAVNSSYRHLDYRKSERLQKKAVVANLGY